MKLLHFTVKQRFLLLVGLRAFQQVRFLNLPNAFQDFAKIAAPQIGQLIENVRLAHGLILVPALVLCKLKSLQNFMREFKSIAPDMENDRASLPTCWNHSLVDNYNMSTQEMLIAEIKKQPEPLLLEIWN